MKKFLVLLLSLVILAAGCSKSPTEQAEGKWQNDSGDIITIEKNTMKVSSGVLSLEGSVKDSEKYKGLSEINLSGEKGYIEVKDDVLYALDKPNEDLKSLDKDSKFKKIK
ncbi:hypothetical protein ACUW90_002360 [Staphylococcus simulans]|uniref:hypothetical protein n=1 Tax=Staphylococcus simulans TaxID=1286 RepID=UPI0030BF8AE2